MNMKSVKIPSQLLKFQNPGRAAGSCCIQTTAQHSLPRLSTSQFSSSIIRPKPRSFLLQHEGAIAPYSVAAGCRTCSGVSGSPFSSGDKDVSHGGVFDGNVSHDDVPDGGVSHGAMSDGGVPHGGSGKDSEVRQSPPGQDAVPSLPDNAIVADALSHHTRVLEAALVPEADLSAEHLVAAVLGTSRAALRSVSDRVLTPDERDRLERYVMCRLQRMPVQYIVGEWDFHNITLDVRPPVFIPRPETEQLVERVLGCVRGWPGDGGGPRLLELCAGSGAVSLALLQACPHVEVTAVEQSGQAVALAGHNARKLGLLPRLSLVHGKVERDSLPQLPLSTYDIIVSNPPYVPSRGLAKLEPEIFLYEDLRALDGGPDGLDVVRNILWHAANLLSDGGRLFLEVDQTHAHLLPAWLQKRQQTAEGCRLLPLHVDQIEKDVFGRFRYITIVKRSPGQ